MKVRQSLGLSFFFAGDFQTATLHLNQTAKNTQHIFAVHFKRKVKQQKIKDF